MRATNFLRTAASRQLDDAGLTLSQFAVLEALYHVGPIASLVLVLAAFVVGIAASMLRDRRDPAGAAERRAAA